MTSSPAAAQCLRDLARLRRVRDRIDREYAQPLDVQALARGAHLSAGHLSRQFRRTDGESPYGYLRTRRIERAMALLRGGDLRVTEVCFAVGCGSLGSFSSRFTELVGVAPQTDGSYYVGFEAVGQHIGLLPGGGPQGMTSPVAYWHVPDLEAMLTEVTAAGAAVKEPAHDVGGRRLVARRL